MIMIVGAQVVLIFCLARVAFIADFAVEEFDRVGRGDIFLRKQLAYAVEVCCACRTRLWFSGTILTGGILKISGYKTRDMSKYLWSTCAVEEW